MIQLQKAEALGGKLWIEVEVLGQPGCYGAEEKSGFLQIVR